MFDDLMGRLDLVLVLVERAEGEHQLVACPVLLADVRMVRKAEHPRELVVLPQGLDGLDSGHLPVVVVVDAVEDRPAERAGCADAHDASRCSP